MVNQFVCWDRKVFVVLAVLLVPAGSLRIVGVISGIGKLAADTTDNLECEGGSGWFVPQINGNLVWMPVATANQLVPNISSRFINPVSFYLFTKSSPNIGTKIEPKGYSVASSRYNRKHPTRFVIHGWTQNYASSMNTRITKAWLSTGDYNVFVVDWARARAEYITAVAGVSGAGRKVGEMIKYLQRHHGLRYDTLHVIGHSLGAHVAGHAGKTVGSKKIAVIVGLDPALPFFCYKKPHARLSVDDAVYVESIQTNGGKLGFLQPIGKATFYPNGGTLQPGCGLDPTGACSHGRSHVYYAEAIERNNFPTARCPNYEAAWTRKCPSKWCNVRMAASINPNTAQGIFSVPVHEKAPFGWIK